jgi:hypothetical protein
MQEMAELKKLYSTEIDRLRQDPFAVLKELGIDPDELSYSHLERKVQEAQKSPEEQERDRLQKELEELRGKAKQEEEKRIQSEQSRLQEQAAKQLDDEIDDALDEYKHLPRSPRVVKHIASVMMWALDNGMEDITVKDVLPTVEKEIKKEISDIIDNLPEEFIEEFIGQRGMETYEKLAKKKTTQVPNATVIKSTDLIDIEIESGLGYTEEGKRNTMIQIIEYMRNLAKDGLISQDAVALVIKRFLEVFQFGNLQEFMEAMEKGPPPVTEAQLKEMQVALLSVIKDLQGAQQNATNPQPMPGEAMPTGEAQPPQSAQDEDILKIKTGFMEAMSDLKNAGAEGGQKSCY